MMQPLEVLTSGLSSSDPVVAGDAARLLGELGQVEAVPALMEYAKNGRYHYKSAANWALGILGDKMDPALQAEACAALRQVVAQPNVHDDWYWYSCRGVRASAAIALLMLGDAGGADYLRELADKNHDVFFRWFAPAILRLKGGEGTLPAIGELQSRLTAAVILDPEGKGTRKTEPGLLTMKAEALGILGGPEACAELLELMRFHSRYVRGRAALSLLEASGSPEHIAAVEVLADKDPTDFVRIKASLALALWHGRLAHDVARVCSETSEPHRSESTSGRSSAGRRCHDFIARAAGGLKDDFDRAVALESLGLLGRKEDAAVVRRQLKHRDAYVRQCALEALERIDVEAAADAAKKMIRDRSPRGRLQAAKVLSGISEDAPTIRKAGKGKPATQKRRPRRMLTGGNA